MSIKSRFVYVENGELKKKLEERVKKLRGKGRGKREERGNIRKVFENIISLYIYIYIYTYEAHTISFQTFFVWAFKIGVDS